MNVSKDRNRKGGRNGPTSYSNNNSYSRNKPRGSDPNIQMSGVYGNSRFAYGVTSLIGCPVRVEVRNGGQYEGIFLTFSSKMEVVLQMARKVEGDQEAPLNRDQCIDAIIFKASDILSITATNVDLDYALRDSFTDSAISKFNGEVIGRELERWDADGPDVDLSLDSDTNGWKPSEMFKTNKEMFDVKSSYDSNLTEYTTPLHVDDSQEGKMKAARAARLASEIEGTAMYKHNLELENLDEDESQCAVIREPPSRDPSAPPRYVPPALRKHQAGPHAPSHGSHGPSHGSHGPSHGSHGPSHGSHGSHGSHHQPNRNLPPRFQNQQNQMNQQNGINSHSNLSQSPHHHAPPESRNSADEHDKNKKNQRLNSDEAWSRSPPIAQGDRGDRVETDDGKPQLHSAADQVVPPVTDHTNTASTPPVQTESSASTTTNSPSPVSSTGPPPASLPHSKSEHTKLHQRDDINQLSLSMSATTSHIKPSPQPEHKKSDDLKAEISDLKDFSDNFKLSSDTPATAAASGENRSEQTSKQQRGTSTDPGPPAGPPPVQSEPTTPAATDPPTSGTSTPSEDTPEKKKSTLNPNAREFTLNPNAREFKPSAPVQQVATSPRPHVQSPGMQPQPQPLPTYPAQAMYAPAYMTGHGQLVNPQVIQVSQHQPAKRAVVSVVRSDQLPSAQALAATGQPLQAQPAGSIPGQPYIPQFMVGPAQNMTPGIQQPMYSQQMVQMTTNAPRLMQPQQMTQMAQMPGTVIHHHQMTQQSMANVQPQQQQPQQQPQQQQQQPQAQTVFIGPGLAQQQIPAGQQQHHHPHYQAHHPRATPPQSSHPTNPSPQQQQQQPPPQQQQQIHYHHNGAPQPIQAHPPLQPSPHTPTSPQTQQPPMASMPYQFSPAFTQGGIPTHTNNPAMHQMAINHMQVTPQVSYTAHNTHGPTPHHNHVMMIQTQPQPPHQHVQQGPPPGPHPMQHQPQHMHQPMHINQAAHPGHPIQPPQSAINPAGMNLPTGQIHYTTQPMMAATQNHMRGFQPSQ